MPKAQWVLDAAYSSDAVQAIPIGSLSPQRIRRGAAPGLHLDLRGASSAGRGAASPATAQWKPPHMFKTLGANDVGSQTATQQPHMSLHFSVLSTGQGNVSTSHGAVTSLGTRFNATVINAASHSTAPSGHGCSQPQPIGDPAAPTRGLRGPPSPQPHPSTRPPGPTAALNPARLAAASTPSSAANGTAATPSSTAQSRPQLYNPLLPRQGSASASRPRPSTEPHPHDPSLMPPGVVPATAAAGVGVHKSQRRSSTSGYLTNSSSSTSASGGGAAAAVAFSSGCSNFLPASSSPYPSHPIALDQLPHQRRAVGGPGTNGGGLQQLGFTAHAHVAALYGSSGGGGHPPGDAVSVRGLQAAGAAPGTGTSPRGGGGSYSVGGVGVGGEQGGSLRGRSRFDPGDGSARRPSYEIDVRQQQMLGRGEAGGSAGFTVLGASVVAPSSGGACSNSGAGASRTNHQRSGQPQHPPPPPPAQAYSTSQLGAVAAAGSSPVGSGTEDSALEYFGLYEDDASSGEGEAVEEDEDEGDEEGGEEEGTADSCSMEEAGSSGGRSASEGVRSRSRVGSRCGVRSTESVHAARRAAAAAASAGAVAKGKPSTSAPPPRPASGLANGRPPAAPLPPAHPQPRRSNSQDTGGAGGGHYGRRNSALGKSGGSRDGSAPSKAGSRPATASSILSGEYEALLPPEMMLPPGAVRHTGSAPSGSETGGGGAAAAATRRRAASNPRDATTLDVRRGAVSVGGVGAGVDRGLGGSRCSSAASSRRGGVSVGRGEGGGGGAEKAAVQALALLATLALVPPSSPGGASATSSAASQRRRPLTSGRTRKVACTTGGSAAKQRPLHPAVLALADVTAPSKDHQPTDQIPTDAKGRFFPYVLPPVFPGTCPTIAFVGTAADNHGNGLVPLMSPTLYVKYGGVANTPVRTAFREAGLRPTRKGKRWNVQWGGILDATAFAKLHNFQRVNHFPGTWELGHKGHLYRNVYAARRRARGPAVEAFDIVPRFYIMPRDYEEFRSDCERFPDRLYIQKPTNSSRGRGIRMVTRPDAIPRDAKDLLVQHYIANPLLLNGFKFDMRVYAAATCLDPLRLYVFPDGLARLATEPYSADRADLSKRCVHLTNYSVNKKSNKFVKQPDQAAAGAGATTPTAAAAGGTAAAHVSYSSRSADPSKECEGSKWSLSGLRSHLEAQGLGPGWGVVWRQVCDIVAAAVIAAEPRMNTEFKMKVPHRNNCFEVWGFDIMLTETFRAWLIEANTCPSLAADSGLDMRVKCSMVSELMHLIGPVPYDVEVYEKAAEAKRQARLTGLPVAQARLAATTAGGSGGGGGDDEALGTLGLAAQQSFGAAAMGGNKDAAGGSCVVQPRSLHELEAIDFTALSVAELPDVVLEAEAEMARKGSWQRVFPCEEDPVRYLNLFETPRLNNLMLCKYYLQMGGRAGGSRGNGDATAAAADLLRRPGSFTTKASRWGAGSLGGVSGGGASRPPSREWRPGGGGG